MKALMSEIGSGGYFIVSYFLYEVIYVLKNQENDGLLSQMVFHFNRRKLIDLS